MYARVSTIQGSTDQIDDGIDRLRETTVPAVKQLDGCKGIVTLVDRQSGKSVAITLWETEDAMRASEEQANRLRREAADSLGDTGEPIVERYEVAVYEVESPVTV
jgi:heme-degrading monooxygenase HmoA